MAGKKEFLSGNPALAYLLDGTSEDEKTQGKDVPTEEKKPAASEKKKTRNNTRDKKNSTPEAEKRKKDKGKDKKIADEETIPKGYVLKPEAKSKRINLLIQPSLYEEAKQMALKEKISFNELVSRAVREYIGK